MAAATADAAALLSLLRTQEDATSQIATYLTLADLFHAIQSCRAASKSALRHHVHRATRLKLPPDEARASALVAGLDDTARASIRHVDAADMRSVALIQSELTMLRSLRLNHYKYLLRDEPFLDLSRLRAFPQLVTLDLSHLTELDDITGIEALSTSLQFLDLSNTAVGDVTPLYMFTQMLELNLDSTPVFSIAPLTLMEKLRSLDISYTRNLNDLKPLKALPRLKKLALNRKSMVRLDTLMSIAERLQYLEIADTNVQSIRISDRDAFVSALTSIEHLDLSWSRFLIRLDAVRPLKNLRVLNLSGEKYTDLSPLADATAIEELFIKQDVDVDLSAIATLKNLSKLYVYGFRPHTSSVQFLGELPHLEVLDVSSLFRLGMPTLPQLKSFGVTVLSYSDYFKYPQAPQLTSLRVFSRVDVNQFVARFANLRHLYLEDVGGIALYSLAQFTQLGSLEIGRKGTQSTPVPEDHSFLRPLKQLRTLRIHWTTISDLFVLTGMKQLEELTLDGTSVSDIWHLTALHDLQVLSVLDTKVRNVVDLIALTKLRKISIPKNASCSSLLDAFHTGSGLDGLKEVCHPTQNCLWGQHRGSA